MDDVFMPIVTTLSIHLIKSIFFIVSYKRVFEVLVITAKHQTVKVLVKPIKVVLIDRPKCRPLKDI